MRKELTIILAAALIAPAALAQEAGQQPGKGKDTAAEATAGSEQQQVRASKLIGAKVQSQDGQSLGEVEDIVLNPQSGQIQFVVLGRGGFLGLGEKLVPVPWQALNIQSEQEDLTVSMNQTQEKLRTAPTFEKDQYTQMEQPDVIIRVYRFYEVEPIGVGAPGEATETERGQQEKEKQTPPQQPE